MFMSSPLTPRHPQALTFGDLLRYLRRRHGLTQAQLGERVGLSGAHISHLEKNQRLPDVMTVTTDFVHALSLQEEPRLVAQLIELAAHARGEHPPLALVKSHAIALHEPSPLHLPHPPNTLIGREHELSRACDRLLEHPGRLLTLIGAPGVGKTRLGMAVAARLGINFRDGAYFVPLATMNDPELLTATVLKALGADEQTLKVQAPATRFIEWGRRKELLLVLDNFEHLSAAAPLVAEWLAACPHLYIVVTSRAPLRLRAEQRLQVLPLSPAAAVELFVQRAHLVEPDFTLTAINQPWIESLCRRLDYLPLAIELMAARLDTCGMQALAARLEQGATLDLLTGGGQDLPPRHRTLRRAIEYSYALLSEAEQRLFRFLSIMKGPFDSTVIQACGAEQATFQRLLQMSLIQKETDEEGNRHYRLLETLREFAREQLISAGESEKVLDWHQAFFQEQAKR